MPAAAGDGLLSEPPGVAGSGGGGGEARRAAAGAEGSFLAAWLSAAAAAPRERLRDFQHTKRVGNYLIGRKLGEGSFAKVREGLHVLTGEKVSGREGPAGAGRRPLGGAPGVVGVPAVQGAVPGWGCATYALRGYSPVSPFARFVLVRKRCLKQHDTQCPTAGQRRVSGVFLVARYVDFYR